VEVAGGLWTGSLTLLADAGHMLADVAGLLLSLLAVRFARRPPSPSNTYGYVRTEILAALVNAVVLLGVAVSILVEAYRRLWTPPEVLALPMLVIAALGLGVNLAGMGLLHAGSRESLTLHSAYVEVLGDALGSVGAIAAALLIQTTGFRLADPLMSTALALVIIPRTWGLLRRTVHVLMEGVPPHLDPREIEGAMRTTHGVCAVHDLHVWTLTSGQDALSAHVLVEDLADGRHVLGDLQHLLRDRFRVEHVTIQLESDRSPLVQIAGPARSPAGAEPEAP
jgi:cobalt-zinc-cadmium efflux system protein